MEVVKRKDYTKLIKHLEKIFKTSKKSFKLSKKNTNKKNYKLIKILYESEKDSNCI